MEPYYHRWCRIQQFCRQIWTQADLGTHKQPVINLPSNLILQLITSITMAVSTLAMAIASLPNIDMDPLARSWISVFAIALFIAGFAAGPGILFWIIVNEIFPK